MNRLAAAGRLILAALLFAAALPAASALADPAGDFDFYVLSLSWSPTYCEDRGQSDRIQCGSRPFAFVVHGLWPQYERGYPSDCPTNQRGVSRRTVDGMLDVMPSPSLVRHEWQKHGTCSGLDPAAYFSLVRKAFSSITIPTPYVDVQDYRMVSPYEVEKDFIRSNAGLKPGGISVTCDSRRLKEVRICLTRDLDFRACPEVERAACRRGQVVMPPVR